MTPRSPEWTAMTRERRSASLDQRCFHAQRINIPRATWRPQFGILPTENLAEGCSRIVDVRCLALRARGA